jgi:LysM repeat protein
MARLSRLIAGVSLTVAGLALPAAVVPAVVWPAGSAEAAGVYVVQEGDTLSGIAASLGVPLNDLLQVNGLTLTSLILPGQRLVVPAGADGGSSGSGGGWAPSGASYTVVAGDTLSGIAARHGVRLAALLSVNGLVVTSLITPGMQLALPAGATPTAAVPDGPAAAAIAYALAQVGKPYRFFTAGPIAYDCSGLTMAAYRSVGVDLVHHSATQALQGRAVDPWSESVRAGDLVFLDSDWDGVIDHVGIALGGWTWVQASQTRGVVMTGPMPPKSVIVAVRRVV